MKGLLVLICAVCACTAVTVNIERKSSWGIGGGMKKMYAICKFTIPTPQPKGQWTVDVTLNKPTSSLTVSRWINIYEGLMIKIRVNNIYMY